MEVTLTAHFQTPIQLEFIHSLWAGYGSVHRLTTPSLCCILKFIKPPKTANTDSHKRKISSYAVEQAFYSAKLKIPGCVFPTALEFHIPDFLFLNDLKPDFPMSRSTGDFNLNQTKSVLRWLSAFHAYFWQEPTQIPNLWTQGNYWHLSTRLAEFQNIARQFSHLKSEAHNLDKRLQGWIYKDSTWIKTDKFKTLVHGDVKDENILFSSDWSRCALYDFQYVGEGYPTVDLVYFLTSSVDSSLVDDMEDEMLKFYYDCLMEKLEVDDGFTYDIFIHLYEIAILDYARFMAGWGWWGNVDWIQRRCKHILKRKVDYSF